jgi:hypothetical protein
MKNKETIITFNTGSLLLIAFIVLKLCKVIDWSWWWVLSPIWIPIALIVILLILKFIVEDAQIRRY